MKITDEMVSKACDAYVAEAVGGNIEGLVGMRAALNFVAPFIRSAALEEAAQVAEDRLGVRSDGVATAIRALKDDRTPTAGDFV